MMAGGKRPLIQLPTGTGKSLVLGLIARMVAELDDRPQLAVAHKRELVGRLPTKDDHGRGLVKCLDAAGFETHVEQASAYARPFTVNADQRLTGRPVAVVGSVPTMQGKRLRKWNDDRVQSEFFALVQYDECHHAAADTWRAHIDNWALGVRIAGFTATAMRPGLADIFELVHFAHEPGGEPHPGMSLRQAIDAGWLVEPHQRVVTIKGWDLSLLKAPAGGLDVTNGQIERSLTSNELEASAETTIAPVLRVQRLLIGLDKTLSFWPGVASAGKAASWMGTHLTAIELEAHKRALLDDGVDAETVRTITAQYADPIMAGCITGKTDDATRELNMRRFGRWSATEPGIQYMSNVGVFTEGVDVPSITKLILIRPTKSEILYFQQIGRVLRPAEELAPLLGDMASAHERREAIAASTKPRATILYFTGHGARKFNFWTLAKLLHDDMPHLGLEDLRDAEESGDELSYQELQQRHEELRLEREQAAEEQRLAYEARQLRARKERAQLLAQPAEFSVDDLNKSVKQLKGEREARATSSHTEIKNYDRGLFCEERAIRVPDSAWSRWFSAKRLPDEPIHRTPGKLKDFNDVRDTMRDWAYRALSKQQSQKTARRISDAIYTLSEAWTGIGTRNELQYWHKQCDPSWKTPWERRQQQAKFRGGKRRKKASQ